MSGLGAPQQASGPGTHQQARRITAWEALITTLVGLDE